MRETVAVQDIFSAVALTVGTMVGVGLLAVPLGLGLVGFVPGLLIMLVTVVGLWLAGYALAERAIALARQDADLALIAANDLGTWTRWVVLPVYLLMFYSVLVAYLTAAQSSLMALVGGSLGPTQWTMIAFAVVSLFIVFGQSIMLRLNALVLLLMVAAFLILVFRSLGHIEQENLLHGDWALMPLALPILVMAFTYHNIVPLVCKRLAFQRRSIHLALTLGLTIALVLTASWFFVVVGTLPLADSPYSIQESIRAGVPATVPIAQLSGSMLITSTGLIFSLLALLTSYLGVGAALSSFLRDIVPALRPDNRALWVFLLVFLPPLVIALIYPDIFIHMVELVGGIGTVILFGFLPILGFIWQRYRGGRLNGWLMVLPLLFFGVVFLVELGKLAKIV